RNERVFTAAIRTRIFTFLRGLQSGDAEQALGVLETVDDAGGEAWTGERLAGVLEAYLTEHQRLRLDPEARNLRHTYVRPSEDRQSWNVQQMLVDPEEHNDWVAELEVDLPRSRESGAPVLRLLRLGLLAAR
ncbi:MAG: DUF3516 domain-containing protein, partial [Candidatus Latescibacterota bacterium]